MTFGANEDAFPSQLPWEEFTKRRVTIDELRARTANTLPTLMLAHLVDQRSPLLDSSAVADLVKTAAGSIDAEAHAQLVRDLTAIGSWYLLPAARAIADADPDATRKYQAYLSRRGGPAFNALSHILSLLPAEIDRRIAADDSSASHGANLHALHVKDFLTDLERLLPQLIAMITAKKAGRRPSFVLSHSAELAAAAIHQASLTLEPHHHTFKNEAPYLSGTGTKAFLGFFTLLGWKGQPATLVRALLRARAASKNAGESRAIKVGAPSR